jgi:biotin-dependent carboxylase-like uncharacterized protein
MTGRILFERVSPNSTVQDAGRKNVLHYGLSGSGPMDRSAFTATQDLLGEKFGANALEIGMLGAKFTYTGPSQSCAFAGGNFRLSINGAAQAWPSAVELKHGDIVDIQTGENGMYAYCRFEQTLDVPLVLGSYATNLAAAIGGHQNRALKAGDEISLLDAQSETSVTTPNPMSSTDENAPIRVMPGLHADLLGPKMWHALFDAPFKISTSLDRMGVRLMDPQKRFDVSNLKSIVSDAVVAGDIQILGDGTPVVLMRDHQPVGGYPRIATIIDADQDRFAQMRPNTEIQFQSVSLQRAHYLLKGKAL